MQVGKVKDVHEDSSVMTALLPALTFYQKSYDRCYFPLILDAMMKESQIA